MKFTLKVVTLLVACYAENSAAAVAMDRTRVILNGNEESVSVVVTNNNEKLPYLAQAWIENANGVKISSPIAVVPPIQRLEPKKKSQIRLDALPAVKQLPQDRESVYYFNLREIPPRTDKPNTLQIALQTKVKLFYRPAAIVPAENSYLNPWQEKLTVKKNGGSITINNPTPYFIKLIDIKSSAKGKAVKGFKPVMIAPKSDKELNINSSELGSSPLITYINDYGGRPEMHFSCNGNLCTKSK